MNNPLSIPLNQDKATKYNTLIPQLIALCSSETNKIANLGNICAALKQTFDFLWVGFYLVDGNTLVLGPFQGPVACTRIGFGKGVCGSAWMQKKTVIVPDVSQFEGHIACSSLSNSEIVLPIFDKTNAVIGVLDIDSEKLNDFDQEDAVNLQILLNNLNFIFSEQQ